MCTLHDNSTFTGKDVFVDNIHIETIFFTHNVKYPYQAFPIKGGKYVGMKSFNDAKMSIIWLLDYYQYKYDESEIQYLYKLFLA